MQPLNILVADDETLIRLGLKRMLAEFGHDVAMAVDGRDALRLAQHRPFDFGIFDIRMPNMNGLEAARALYTARPIPIIILTAHVDIETIEQAAGFPIQGYLIKPVMEEQLAACIEVAMRRFQESQSAVNRLNEFEQTEETRKIVELARKILTTRGLSEEEAYMALLKSASEQRIPLRKAAEMIVQAGLIEP